MVTGKTTRERASHAVIPPCRNPWLEKWKCVEVGNLQLSHAANKSGQKPKHFNLPSGIRVKTEVVLKLLPMLHHVFLLSRSSSPTLVMPSQHVLAMLRWCVLPQAQLNAICKDILGILQAIRKTSKKQCRGSTHSLDYMLSLTILLSLPRAGGALYAHK